MKNMRRQNGAFTLIELIVGIAITVILAASLVPALARTRTQALRITCANNLKQVGLAFRTWAIAHNGNMPMSLPDSQGGATSQIGIRTLTGSQITSKGVSMMFLAASNELSTPKILFCPAEYESSVRQVAGSFAGTQTGTSTRVLYTNDLNVSYFIGVDASETRPRMFLTGDHNLGDNANPPTSAFGTAPSTGRFFISLGTNCTSSTTGPAWMDSMHSKHGNVGMADGSVEWFSRSNLQNAIRSSGDNGRTLGSFPQAAGTSGLANRIQLP